jgi:hypothetical protein
MPPATPRGPRSDVGVELAHITLNLAAGRDVTFDVDLGLEGPAVFLLGVRRSGSTIFTNIGQALTEANHRRFVNVGRFFDEDVPAAAWQSDPALTRLIAPGNVYGGFRDMPLAFLGNELFLAGQRLMLVRDPRDALVSEYFAMAYSHPVPQVSSGSGGVRRLIDDQRARARSEPIDEFVVRRAKSMAVTLLDYAPVVGGGTTLFRYEDVILHKREWIFSMLTALGWTLHDDELRDILGWADVRPDREDPQAFIRKVTPGDHREKLRPDTIERITATLAPGMALFGYPT